MRWRFVLLLLPTALCPLVIETASVLFGKNLHVVVPGRVYRCAQLDPTTLARIIQDFGIRTVVNLRGDCDPWPWYLNESRTTHELGICQEDISLSAGRMPPVSELRRLIEVLDRAEAPLLLHCRRGSDRTGLASVVVRLLASNDDFVTARKQLGWRYGHSAAGRPGYLDRFFDLYVDWLAETGQTHAPTIFRHWLVDVYRPDCCWARLELLDAPGRLLAGQPTALHVRCANTSPKPWQLLTGTTAGVHLRYAMRDADGRVIASDRAGLFNEVVPAGGHIDLTLATPAIERAGKYTLFIDMIDERHGWFFQLGSEPLELEVVVQ
jgi:protein tyrosine phosphatase (PTP) superfamily phosphohydrolase (DUF442 family)